MLFGRVAWFLALGLLLGGLLAVFSGLRTLSGERHRRESWRSYPGRVVATRLGFDGDQIRCLVAYWRDGTEVRFWNRFTSTMITDPVGRPVEVLANPEDPQDAVVVRGLVRGNVVGGVFVAVGAALTLVGAGVAVALLR